MTDIDIYAKSSQLLESLANSIYDRMPEKPLFFSAKEISIVENFIKELIQDKTPE